MLAAAVGTRLGLGQGAKTGPANYSVKHPPRASVGGTRVELVRAGKPTAVQARRVYQFRQPPTQALGGNLALRCGLQLEARSSSHALPLTVVLLTTGPRSSGARS